MASELILVVDDEPAIVELARLYLEREGFQVEWAGDGEKALSLVRQHRPALIVLDVMLSKLDGFEVCKRLRAESDPTAIIILTARDEDIDKILGLELGADDYLTKPFNPRELVARVKAILRRAERSMLSIEVIHLGNLVVDATRHEVRVNDIPINLRAQEFELLTILIGQPGRVFTREQLLQMAWGFDFLGQTRTVDVHIAQLRRKLAGSTSQIETVTGIGYRLVE
jgi:DNA-binding response OmpR family regulator